MGIWRRSRTAWIEAIELVDGDYFGYWQRGWSDTAPYQTPSRIDEPRKGDVLPARVSHLLAGIALPEIAESRAWSWRSTISS